MIKHFELNFSGELNLKSFLDNYGLDKDRFYARNSFYKLLAETGKKASYEVLQEKELGQSLRRFSRIDSKRLLNFSQRLLTEELDVSLLDKSEELMLGMFHYTIWGNKPEQSYKESLKDLKLKNPDIVRSYSK